MLGLTIIDFKKTIELDPNYATAKDNLNSLLEKNNNTNIFSSIKSLSPIHLSPIKQIYLLNECFDEKTALGKKFHLDLKNLDNIKNHLSTLIKPMHLWILVGYEL